MPAVLQFIVLILAFFFMLCSTIAGLLFIPIILLMKLFEPKVLPKYDLDHVHIPLAKVPPIYYEDYALYLKSDEWKTLRKQVLKRDKYLCVDCLNPGKLQVHHLHYDGIESMTFSMDQLVSVCHTCHAIRHGRDKI